MCIVETTSHELIAHSSRTAARFRLVHCQATALIPGDESHLSMQSLGHVQRGRKSSARYLKRCLSQCRPAHTLSRAPRPSSPPLVDRLRSRCSVLVSRQDRNPIALRRIRYTILAAALPPSVAREPSTVPTQGDVESLTSLQKRIWGWNGSKLCWSW